MAERDSAKRKRRYVGIHAIRPALMTPHTSGVAMPSQRAQGNTAPHEKRIARLIDQAADEVRRVRSALRNGDLGRAISEIDPWGMLAQDVIALLMVQPRTIANMARVFGLPRGVRESLGERVTAAYMSAAVDMGHAEWINLRNGTKAARLVRR